MSVSAAARIFAVCTVGVWVPLATLAQKTTFNPSITVEQGYSDNVQYIDVPDEKVSDTTTAVGIDLPVTRQLKRGDLSFNYSAAYSQSSRFDELDHGQHRVGVGVGYDTSRLAHLRFDATFVKSQQQGNPQSVENQDVEFLLAERTDRTTYGGRLSYSRQVGERWEWEGALGASKSSFDPIFSDAVGAESNVEDRTWYEGHLGVQRQLTRRVALGARYRYQQTELDVSADETAQSAVFLVERSLGEQASVGFELGGYRRSFDDSAEGGGNENLERDGLIAGIVLDYDKPLGPVRFGLSAGVRPTAGGALAGTATNTTLAVWVAGHETRHWHWSASTRYTRRDPTDGDDAETDTVAVGASIERSLLDALGVRLHGYYADQSGRGSDPDAVTGSCFACLVPPRAVRVRGTEKAAHDTRRTTGHVSRAGRYPAPLLVDGCRGDLSRAFHRTARGALLPAGLRGPGHRRRLRRTRPRRAGAPDRGGGHRRTTEEDPRHGDDPLVSVRPGCRGPRSAARRNRG
jgi:hypothetical protein